MATYTHFNAAPEGLLPWFDAMPDFIPWVPDGLFHTSIIFENSDGTRTRIVGTMLEVGTFGPQSGTVTAVERLSAGVDFPPLERINALGSGGQGMPFGLFNSATLPSEFFN